MTTDWWWFQRLRVMTALSLSLWSHFAICLLSPMAFFSLLSLVPSSERNSTIPLISASWRMTVLCLSPLENLLAKELVPAWTLGKTCVWLTRMNYSQHLLGWWRFIWFFFPKICDVCVYKMSPVSIRNHPEIFILSHRVKLSYTAAHHIRDSLTNQECLRNTTLWYQRATVASSINTWHF